MTYPSPTDLVHPSCPNFRWYEVWRSQLATRYGFDNTSKSERVILGAKNLVLYVAQPLRDHFGGYGPQSWYRGERLEKILCKTAYAKWCRKKRLRQSPASWSQYFALKSHPTGGAFDIEIPGVTNDELFRYIRDNLEYDQLIREYPVVGDPRSGWVHVSFAEGANRNQDFALTSKGIIYDYLR